MKKKVLLVIFIISLNITAQFPEPENFKFSFDYIMTDDFGYCDGTPVYGPTYCSHYKWSAPDTSLTTATLEYYRIHYHDYILSDISVIATASDTFYNEERGVIGKVWITAVYSNPEGESDPSNAVTNEDLPIKISTPNISKKKIIFDPINNMIILKEIYGPNITQIFNVLGTNILRSENTANIYVGYLTPGIYIVHTETEGGVHIIKKIIKD